MGKNAAILFVFAALGIAWLHFLASLAHGQGLVALDKGLMIVDWVSVGILSFIVCALGSRIGGYTLLGWGGGQAVMLIYDSMPHGRSPQMFQPTNFGEALLFGGIVVIALNWSMVPGAILGGLLGYRMKHSSKQLKPDPKDR